MPDKLARNILSDITVYLKYARFIPEFGRRELWVETVARDEQMLIKKFPQLEGEIKEAFQFVYDKKVLPSMRCLQFAGKPIEINPCRGYNCSYLPIDSWEAFHETMFLLLGGTGVGYSVQKHHVEKLPVVKQPTKRLKRFVISDSIEGWADAIKILMKSYFLGTSTIDFDFSDIRPKGARLKTSGGRAPGSQPLKDCIHNIRKILDAKTPGDKLTTLECHDIQCYIAEAVLSGGIRRSAMISLFTIDDEDMLTCKYGNYRELNPQRSKANNTAVTIRHKIRKARFMELWDKLKASGTGDPAFWFSNNQEWGINPCCEASLRSFQFCNLTTINGSDIVDQDDFNKRAKAASFIGTLQAGFTNFHYLRDIWRVNTEKDALIGVSITGIATGKVTKLSMKDAAEAVKAENKRVAKLIGINPAARCTVVKPEGTSSLVLGTSSGIHPWHSPYYIRRITLLKNEALYKYLVKKLPQLVEDSYYKPSTEAFLTVPIKAPDGAAFRDEDSLDLLERIKKVNTEWIQPGHRKGDNPHNVSATVSVKENEWDKVGEWMWENRAYYNGLSVFPYDGGNYKQTPFEETDKATYEKMLKHLKEIDLSEIEETDDNTSLKENAACSAGACEVR